MDGALAGKEGRPGRGLARRLARYASVSVVATLTSTTVLGVLVGLLGAPAVWSNLAATAVGTVPSFELNRRWVWSAGGPRSLARQVLPFCALAFLGLVASTLAVHLAGDATARASRLAHTGAVEAASLGAYGTLWVVQFVLCDRLLFRSRRAAA